MKRFLLHILLCLFILVMINFIYIFLVGGNLRDYERRYLAMPKEVDVVVLGDSHARRAWSSSDDPRVFNFAFGSDNIKDMRFKFEYVVKNNTAAGKKIVVLPLDAQLISTYRDIKHNNRQNASINSGLPLQLIYWFPLVFDGNTEFDVKMEVFRLFKPSNKAASSFSERSARQRLTEQFPEDAVSKLMLDEYQSLINDIRSSSYEIVAVRYPLHPFYDSLVDASPGGIYLQEQLDSVAAVNGLKMIDYSSRINDPKYFADQDHLNTEGSVLFIKDFTRHYIESIK
jgi:hypothetical protein